MKRTYDCAPKAERHSSSYFVLSLEPSSKLKSASMNLKSVMLPKISKELFLKEKKLLTWKIYITLNKDQELCYLEPSPSFLPVSLLIASSRTTSGKQAEVHRN